MSAPTRAQRITLGRWRRRRSGVRLIRVQLRVDAATLAHLRAGPGPFVEWAEKQLENKRRALTTELLDRLG